MCLVDLAHTPLEEDENFPVAVLFQHITTNFTERKPHMRSTVLSRAAPLSPTRAKRLLAQMMRRAHIQATGTWTGVDDADIDCIIDSITKPLENRIAALEAKIAQVEVVR